MEIAFYVISVFFSLWLSLSFLICLFWLFNLDLRDDFFLKHRRLGIAIGFGCFLFTLVIIFGGMRSLLGFLPDSWGFYDEEGEFRVLRDSISGTIGFVAAVALGIAYEKMIQLHNEKQALEAKLEAHDEMNRLRNTSRAERQDKYEIYKQKLANLQCKDRLTREERIELDLLYELINELEQMRIR